VPDTGNGNDQSPRSILNPFDPARLRLAQTVIKVREHVTTIPIRKPAREWWVRTHPSEAYRILTYVLELKESNDRDILLVDPDLVDAVVDEQCLSSRLLVTSITRQGTVFLWPLRIPDEANKLDSWNRSALDLAEVAAGEWIRVHADPESASYHYRTAQAAIPPPEWPSTTFAEILRTAFKDHYVDKIDHPTLRKLRGEL
jgi:hypothetical protein